MNRIYKHKSKIAFTLAEMMVILALFSTIAAATLPVITANQTLNDYDSSTDGSPVDPWILNGNYNGLGYYNTNSSLADANAVQIGGQVSEDAYAMGYPQLMIRDIYGINGAVEGSQINLYKKYSGNVYEAGRIKFGGDNSKGAISIGQFNSYNYYDNVAHTSVTRHGAVSIGTYAMGRPLRDSANYNNSIAVGPYALADTEGTLSGTVAVGFHGCSGKDVNTSVCLGTYSGTSSTYSVNIGAYPGFAGSSMYAVNIGSFAGYGTDSHNTVSLGYYAGKQAQSEKIKSMYAVSIGSYANSDIRYADKNFGGNVSIGAYAGSFSSTKGKEKYNVYLGHYAGHGTINSTHKDSLPSIMIGVYAGFADYVNDPYPWDTTAPVIVGNYAGTGVIRFVKASSPFAGDSPVIMGTQAFLGNSESNAYMQLPSAVIGYNAGYGIKTQTPGRGTVLLGYLAGKDYNNGNSICIGSYTCGEKTVPYGLSNGYDVRISNYGAMPEGRNLRNGTSFLGYIETIPLLKSLIDSGVTTTPGTGGDSGSSTGGDEGEDKLTYDWTKYNDLSSKINQNGLQLDAYVKQMVGELGNLRTFLGDHGWISTDAGQLSMDLIDFFNAKTGNDRGKQGISYGSDPYKVDDTSYKSMLTVLRDLVLQLTIDYNEQNSGSGSGSGSGTGTGSGTGSGTTTITNGLPYNTFINMMFGSNNYSNMYISPFGSGVGSFGKTAIILFANYVYGPDTKFKILSDRRLKENIRLAKYGLNDIRKINIYEYQWKNLNIDEPQIGVIAQEMKKIIPEGVYTNEKGYMAINSDWILYAMINAVKDLDKSVENTKNQLTAYIKEYKNLLVRVNKLEKRLKKLEAENKSLTKDVNVAYKKAKNAERQR